MQQRMKVHAASSVLAMALAVLPVYAQQAARSAPAARTPVVVELFTSEGCSSCPPADALLARLDHDQPVANAEIIVLGEHVDYWDSLGWRDRFSSHEATERQNLYAERFRLDGPYTPQMVVDGAAQFVGSDSARVLHGIAEAARAGKVSLALSALTVNGARVSGSVSLVASPAPPDGKADVYAAIVESAASTQVQRGENGGRTLHHAAPLLALQRIGSLDALAHRPLSFSLTAPSVTAPGDLRVVVFLQRPGQGGILGAASGLPAAGASASVAAAK